MTLVILCPGQGDQGAVSIGILMGCPAAQIALDAFRSVIGTSVADVLSVPERAYANQVAQPLVCALAMASFAAISSQGGDVACFAGYSVGELAAYGCAGSLPPEDVIRLAQLRARLMDEACSQPTGMIAVTGLDQASLGNVAAISGAHLAIRNSSTRFVCGGSELAIRDLSVRARRQGATVTELPVRIASHTPLMSSAVAPFRRALSETAFADPSAPVLAGVSGWPVRRKSEAIACLGSQLTEMLDWAACIETLTETRHSAMIELLPGSRLSRMAKNADAQIQSRALADFKTISGATSWIETRRTVASFQP